MKKLSQAASFSTLCDDAIFALFEWLPLNELCSVSRTCTRLQKLSEKHFCLKYPQLLLEKVIVQEVNGTIGFKETANYVKCFGHKIENVEIKQCKYNKQLLRFMRKNCSMNMKRIELPSGEMPKWFLRGIRKILRNVEFLGIGSIEGVSLDDILKHCGQIKRLCVVDWIPHELPARNYPMLEAFELRNDENCFRQAAEDTEWTPDTMHLEPVGAEPADLAEENPEDMEVEEAASDDLALEESEPSVGAPSGKSCGEFDYQPVFARFFEKNPNIKRCVLSVSACVEHRTQLLSAVVENSNIEELFLYWDDNFTPILGPLKSLDHRNGFKKLELHLDNSESGARLNFFELAGLKKLTGLVLSEWIINASATEPMEQLKVLKLCSCTLEEPAEVDLAANLPSLESLELCFCAPESETFSAFCIIDAFVNHSKTLKYLYSAISVCTCCDIFKQMFLQWDGGRKKLDGASKITVMVGNKTLSNHQAEAANTDLINIKGYTLKFGDFWDRSNPLVPFVPTHF